MTDQNKDNESKSKIGWLFVAAIAVLCLWGGSWGMVNHFIEGEGVGLFGDSFGAVNALFTGLALAGLVYTIIQQEHEIKLTQSLIKSQEIALKIQNDAFHQQGFENTFFKILEILDSSLKDVEWGEGGGAKGIEAFKLAFEELSEKIENEGITKDVAAECIADMNGVTKYKRVLIMLLEFIKENRKNDWFRYVQIVRENMTPKEMTCVYWLSLDVKRDAKLFFLLKDNHFFYDVSKGNHCFSLGAVYYTDDAFKRPTTAKTSESQTSPLPNQ